MRQMLGLAKYVVYDVRNKRIAALLNNKLNLEHLTKAIVSIAKEHIKEISTQEELTISSSFHGITQPVDI